MSVQRVVFIGFCGLLGATVLFAGSEPIAVSPGSATGTLIGDRCPTYSWGEVEGAESYELVVYRLGEEEGEAEAVLRRSFPGSAETWTPSLGRCLDRGGRYAWSVRAVGEKTASDWSAPSLFQVASGTSTAELEAALRVVRGYLEAGDGFRSTSGTREAQAEPEAASRGTRSSPGPRAVGTTQMSVDGGIEATSFTGDGSTLTSLTPANLSAGTAAIDITGKAANVTDTVGISHGGTGATTAAAACWNLGAATVANLSAHASGSDHDGRYYTESELQGDGSAQVHWGNLTSLPTITKGDLLVEDGADVVRLAVGTDGQVLMADSGAAEGVSWMSAAIPCPDSPALVPKTGQTTSYDNENDGDLEMGVAWPDPRFTDNGDGTVTDNLTGLTWLLNANCPNALRLWTTALSDVTQLNTNGTMNGNDCGDTSNGGSHQVDWRLPQVKELLSLLHHGVYDPAVPDRAGTGKWSDGNPFSGLQSTFYWSSTTHANFTTHAWFVNFYYGNVGRDLKTGTAYYVWPVRGGQ